MIIYPTKAYWKFHQQFTYDKNGVKLCWSGRCPVSIVRGINWVLFDVLDSINKCALPLEPVRVVRFYGPRRYICKPPLARSFRDKCYHIEINTVMYINPQDTAWLSIKEKGNLPWWGELCILHGCLLSGEGLWCGPDNTDIMNLKGIHGLFHWFSLAGSSFHFGHRSHLDS